MPTFMKGKKMQNVGFWKGLGMAWTAAVMAIVKLFQAAETTAGGVKGVAEAFEESTQVLKENVRSWASADEALAAARGTTKQITAA